MNRRDHEASFLVTTTRTEDGVAMSHSFSTTGRDLVAEARRLARLNAGTCWSWVLRPDASLRGVMRYIAQVEGFDKISTRRRYSHCIGSDRRTGTERRHDALANPIFEYPDGRKTPQSYPGWKGTR